MTLASDRDRFLECAISARLVSLTQWTITMTEGVCYKLMMTLVQILRLATYRAINFTLNLEI